MRSFRELIRYWREHEGLSLSQAAARIGITKAHLWDLESGRATNPTIRTLARLASAYGADLPYLAGAAAKQAAAIRDEHPTLDNQEQGDRT
jgi:transcriptional regulator with XRE-family HTH domain